MVTSPRRSRSRRSGRCASILLAALAIIATACSSATTSSSHGGRPIKGGTATFAEIPGGPPDYIFPLYSLAYYDSSNTALLQPLLFPPLYWFGKGTTLDINSAFSLANSPVFSDNDKTVTITLRHGYTWSNGQPVTSRDVEFWINLLKANKTDYGPYVPGAFPDNVTSVDYPNSSTIIMHLNASYNPQWFTYTALAEITPLPQQAWDKTSASGSVGNYDMTTAGAQKVYKFLDSQSKDTATYSSNPLWQVIDGPWRLQQYTSTGQLTFVPNPKYTGTVKPRLSKLVELPYTSSVAENNSLLDGSLDYGYISVADAGEIPRLQQQGYRISPWPLWGVNYLYVNYTNPTSGPFMKQQYVRIAMQELINQPEYVRTIYHNLAYPTYGPVPTRPVTSFASPSEQTQTNLYPYDPAKAIASLRSHGWNVVPNGTTTCADPAKCGPGIAKGASLTITEVYPTGFPEILEMMEAMQSSMTAAGIKMNLTGLTNNGIGAILGTCKPGSPCKWGLIDYEVAYYFAPGPYPDGGAPFGTGAAFYEGTAPFSAQLDRLIANVRTAPASQATAALYAYEHYVQVINPNLWIPMTYGQISVIKDTLQGTEPQNPVAANMTPQTWYLTSGGGNG